MATVVRGALLLTIAGFISKILSATYRIPLQNLTGDLGFYIYQQVYPLLGAVMILTLYGFPVAISTLTAERRRDKLALTFQSFYFPLFIILFIINGTIFALLFGLAPKLSIWIADTDMIFAFRLAAISFLFIPFLALLRGVSQGYENMELTAYSQVIEQLIRVALIILAAYLVFVGQLDIYRIGEAGALATILGMIVGIIYLAMTFPKRARQGAGVPNDTEIPWKYYIMTCLSLGMVASFNHMILLFMQMVDVFTLVPSLIQAGLPKTIAMEAKGVFDRGQPLIQLGVVLGSSFALALVPNVVRTTSSHPAAQAHSIREALLFAGYLAAGATVGLVFMMEETNVLLFTNNDGTVSLQILALTLVFTSLTITAAVMLQSIGYVKQVAYFIGIAVIIKILLNKLLVPVWTINGSALATSGSMIVLCWMTFHFLQKKLPHIQFFHHVRWLVVVGANSVMALFIVSMRYLWLSFFPMTRWAMLMYVVIVVPTGACIYIAVLLRYGVFSKKQLQAFPLSRLIMWVEQRIRKQVGEK